MEKSDDRMIRAQNKKPDPSPSPVGRVSRAATSRESTGFDDATIYSTERTAGILLVLAGMALQWAALHSITFADTVFRGVAAAGSGSAWAVNSLCTFTVFLILFFVSKRITSLLSKRSMVPFMATCLAGGMTCPIVGNFFLASEVLVYVGNALIA